MLFTFSCSSVVDADLFQKIVFGAVADTDRKAQIIGRLAQGADHPVALTFPEGAYLKGLIAGCGEHSTNEQRAQENLSPPALFVCFESDFAPSEVPPRMSFANIWSWRWRGDGGSRNS